MLVSGAPAGARDSFTVHDQCLHVKPAFLKVFRGTTPRPNRALGLNDVQLAATPSTVISTATSASGRTWSGIQSSRQPSNQPVAQRVVTRAPTQAIRHNPWAPAARTAETVVGWGEHYGVDALISGVITHAREDVTLQGRAEYAAQIRAWRTQSGMTLRQLARAAGTSASRLSAYENAKVAPTTDVLGRLSHAAGVR
jgi:DNA-binding transcriptional regulator YiaG